MKKSKIDCTEMDEFDDATRASLRIAILAKETMKYMWPVYIMGDGTRTPGCEAMHQLRKELKTVRLPRKLVESDV